MNIIHYLLLNVYKKAKNNNFTNICYISHIFDIMEMNCCYLTCCNTLCPTREQLELSEDTTSA